MPTRSGALTHHEQSFARHFAATGDVSYASMKAGYASPAGGSNALRRPTLQRRIAAIRENQLSDALTVAIGALVEIAGDRNKAPAPRVAAADKILKASGQYRPPESQDDRDVFEMSRDELQTYSLRALEEMSQAATILLEGDVIRPEPAAAPAPAEPEHPADALPRGGIFD